MGGSKGPAQANPNLQTLSTLQSICRSTKQPVRTHRLLNSDHITEKAEAAGFRRESVPDMINQPKKRVSVIICAQLWLDCDQNIRDWLKNHPDVRILDRIPIVFTMDSGRYSGGLMVEATIGILTVYYARKPSLEAYAVSGGSGQLWLTVIAISALGAFLIFVFDKPQKNGRIGEVA